MDHGTSEFSPRDYFERDEQTRFSNRATNRRFRQGKLGKHCDVKSAQGSHENDSPCLGPLNQGPQHGVSEASFREILSGMIPDI